MQPTTQARPTLFLPHNTQDRPDEATSNAPIIRDAIDHTCVGCVEVRKNNVLYTQSMYRHKIIQLRPDNIFSQEYADGPDELTSKVQ